MLKTRFSALIAGGACAVALGACGGDDAQTTPADTAPSTTGASGSETAPTTGALDKKEYLEQADEICANANKEINAIDSEEAFQTEAPPLIQGALTELRALPAPEGDEQQLDDVYSKGEEALATLEGATEPPQGDPFEEFTKAADDYGFKGGCTRNRG